ncbi:MAG: hypothetical protein AB7F76_12380 [Parvibaculaceae bacterium]
MKRKRPVAEKNGVDTASRDSFPASDPPSFTPIVREGRPRPEKKQPASKPKKAAPRKP